MRITIAVLCLTAAPVFAQTPAIAPDKLALSCPGQSTFWMNTSLEASAAPAAVNRGGTVQVEIVGEKGRIRLTPEMGGDAESWSDLTSLKMEPARITAVYRKNFLSRYSVTIDRLSGEIRMEDGGNRFHGNCSVASDKPKF